MPHRHGPEPLPVAYTFSQWLTRPLRRLPLAAAIAAVGLGAIGCETKSWLDPSELVDPQEDQRLNAEGRARPRLQPILSELDLGVATESSQFTTARDVQLSDLRVIARDYRIGPGDLLKITINDFPAPGQIFTDGFRVSDTGLVNLPDVGEVRVGGMTETEAVEAIEQAYVEAGIFANDPSLTVLVVEANNRVFSIIGNVGAPGRYVLTKADFRLLDAFALARGAADARNNSDYAYVVRSLSASQPPQNGGAAPANNDPLQPRNNLPGNPTPGGNRDPLRPGASVPPTETNAPNEWAVYASAAAAQANQPGGGFQFQAPTEPVDIEIVRVPLQELLSGQLKYNIVVRPEDTIIVPTPETGEYYMGGHVRSPGAYAILPGRRLTMKQAIVSAGMLDPVAIPGRTQLIRRVADTDVFVRVDLAKVFVGQEPDVYLEPNDMILVGTNLPAPFLAAFRNAFRVTYGFGFLYDRNFAYDTNQRIGF